MGGGAMVTTAKAAALGGYRSVGSLAGRAAAALRARKPASATVSPMAPAAEGGPAISIASTDKGLQEAVPVSAVQRPAWEIDDWEFAGRGEEQQGVALDSLHPAPRLVFGPVPTLEEAKEATSDLKDAIEEVYFSPNHCEASAIVPPVPRHVVQTFSLLQGSTEVQDVVASLAADKNVWDAVMKNEKVMEFYSTHMSTVIHPESDADTEVYVSDIDHESSVADINGESSSAEATGRSAFADFVHNVKVKVHNVSVKVVHNVKEKVVEVVSNISGFLQEFLETSAGTSSSTSTKTRHDTDKPFVGYSTGASFMLLAIAAILVVVLKRG